MMTGFGWGFGYFGMIMMVVFWGLLIAGGVWVAKVIFSSGTGQHLPSPPAARDILDQRYARGELTREQYELMKQDLA
jgi:putative membrane protein